jgi:hypothetical protein
MCRSPPQVTASSFTALVVHINHDLLHHAAEIQLLRDLYRDTPR